MPASSPQQKLLRHLAQGRLDLAQRDLNQGASLWAPSPPSDNWDQLPPPSLEQFQNDLWWAAIKAPIKEGVAITAGWDWLKAKGLPLDRIPSLGSTHLTSLANVLEMHPLPLADWLETHLHLTRERLCATPFLPWRALQRANDDPSGLEWLSCRGVPLEHPDAWYADPMIFSVISQNAFQSERQVTHLLAHGVKPAPRSAGASTPRSPNGNTESPLGRLSRKYRSSIDASTVETEASFRRLWVLLTDAGDSPTRAGPFGSPQELIQCTPAQAWHEARIRASRVAALSDDPHSTPRVRPRP